MLHYQKVKLMNSNKNFIVLALGLSLLFLGLSKTNFIYRKPSTNTTIDSIAPPSPPDYLIAHAEKIVESLVVNSDCKKDAKVMQDFYLDIATLISLDGDKDVVIKNTEEIKQANSLSALLINLDIKGKYPNYAENSRSLVVTAIGDDSVQLNDELRKKAVEAFQSIAWAWHKASK